MADNINVLNKLKGTFDPKRQLGRDIDVMMGMAEERRRKFERRWFDNNFFDDGYHFKYVSRTTGKIVDLSARNIGNMPVRAIPKASRQIRGVANLIMSQDPHPTVYPQKINIDQFQGREDLYKLAQEEVKRIAIRQGDYLESEWDRQGLSEKLIQMLILSAKNSISYLQVYPDPVDEAIKTRVRDAFDVYLLGNYTNLQDVPFIVLATPELITRIKANELFEEEQLEKLSPDNKYASSELKQAYLQSRYGWGKQADEGKTILLKEMYRKEYISDKNIEVISSNFPWVMEGRKIGDVVMRHVFSAGGVWLKDEYLDMDKYPFVDFRYEPGPLYQTAFIERFIPQNKSLDLVVSRIERYLNTMVTGHWLVRKGEDIKITNIPGGQKMSYKGTPPVQGKVSPLPQAVFAFPEMLERYIEEQGASTSALNQLPPGVKSGVAIESLKATEFANLKISIKQFKKTVKEISEMMIGIASDYFLKPQEFSNMNSGEAAYFNVIGRKGADLRKEIGQEIPNDTVIIDKNMRVDIDIDTELAYTESGKREVAQQLLEYMIQLAEIGYISKDAVKVVLEKFLETFKFGATAEFMQALDDGTLTSLTEDELLKIKIAVVEAMRDAGVAGKQAQQQQVDATKVGMMQAVKDLGGNKRATT